MPSVKVSAKKEPKRIYAPVPKLNMEGITTNLTEFHPELPFAVVRHECQLLASRCIQALKECLSPEHNPKIRIEASKTLLELGYGKAEYVMAERADAVLKDMSNDELLAIIAEQQAGDGRCRPIPKNSPLHNQNLDAVFDTMDVSGI